MMNKISGMIDFVSMTFERLSSRERTLVAFGGVALLLFVTVITMASVNSSLGNLEESIEILNDNYVMIDKLRSRYDEAKKTGGKRQQQDSQQQNQPDGLYRRPCH